MGEKPVSQLYLMLAELKMKPNLLQSGAVTLQLCLDDNPEKLEKLAHKAGELFDIQIEKGLSLLTIRHYTESVIERTGCSQNKGFTPANTRNGSNFTEALIISYLYKKNRQPFYGCLLVNIIITLFFSLTEPFKRSGWNNFYTGLDSISVLTDIGCKNGFFK